MPQGGNFSTEDLRRYNVELEDLKLFLVKNLETEATQVRMVSDIHVIKNENLQFYNIKYNILKKRLLTLET